MTFTVTYLGFEIEADFEYYPGTNYIINSASSEPNDPPEIEFIEFNSELPQEFLAFIESEKIEEFEQAALEQLND